MKLKKHKAKQIGQRFFSAPTDKKKFKSHSNLNNIQAKGQQERMMLLNEIITRKKRKSLVIRRKYTSTEHKAGKRYLSTQ